MIKKILSAFLLVAITITLSSCSHPDPETEKLTYYALKEDVKGEEWFYSLIQKYNKYCLKNLDESYQIEVVTFDSESEMNLKISTEIMAGGGPDILNTNQKLPFEKLIENGSLLNIDTLFENDKTYIYNCNQTVMQAGVFDGERYIIPLYYKVDYLVSSESKLENLNITSENGIAFVYDEIDEIFENFINARDDISFFDNQYGGSYFIDVNDFFYSFINSYIDFENKQVYFDTEEFRNALPYMKELVSKVNKEKTDSSHNDYLFYDFYSTASPRILSGVYARLSDEGEKLVVTRGFLRDAYVYSGNIQMGIAFNSNTKYRDKASEFIKYALSEDVQGYFIGLNSRNNFVQLNFPVNNNTYKSLKEKSNEYTDDFGDVIGYGASDNEFIQNCFEMAENIKECSIYENLNNTYFGTSVIGEIVQNYLTDSISEDKFIWRLTSATKMYMLE